MATINGITTKISGKVGGIVFQQRNGRTVVYEAPVVKKTPRRTEQQMGVRMQWANLVGVYRLFDGTLRRGFENLPGNQSVLNAFIQANLDLVKVYITKAMRLNGGCLLAPYQITRGSLPSIGVSKNNSNILVSTISMGSLTISAETTVAQFSQTLLENNADWQEGDQLTFFHGVQTTDSVTHIPRATLTPHKVVINLYDETPLWNIVGSTGFSTVDGHLAMNTVLTSAAAAWVHSRENAQGDLKVSSQFLTVENAALASYQTNSALINSANSYGGINSADVYLKPSTAADASATTPATPSSSTSTPDATPDPSGGNGEN